MPGALHRLRRPAVGREEHRAAGDGRGFTLVEVLVTIVIVSMLALATGGTARVIFATRDECDQSGFADELGVSLLEEIAVLPFDDPQSGGTALGPEAGEWVAFGTRVAFDDVDDYTVWTGGMPLQQKDGTLIAQAGYTRTVSIGYVSPTQFSLASFTPTDCKQITVTVLYKGSVVGTYATVRIQGGRHVDSDG